jgi:hypothetical protein
VKRMRAVVEGRVVSIVVYALLMSFGMGSLALAASLSDEEREMLSFLAEEERLARDVYRAFHDKWGLTLFDEMAKSEQTHLDAVKEVLKRYGIPDPTESRKVGEFTDLMLRESYDELLPAGLRSLKDALDVAREIEQSDLDDLAEALAGTRRDDLKALYSMLRKATEKHLQELRLNQMDQPLK